MYPPFAPCPLCGAPLSYVPQYGQWYCARCQRYPAARFPPVVPAPSSHPIPQNQATAAPPWPIQAPPPLEFQPAPSPHHPAQEGPAWPPGYPRPDAELTRTALLARILSPADGKFNLSTGWAHGFIAALVAAFGALYLLAAMFAIDGYEFSLGESMPFLGAILAAWLVLGVVQAYLVFNLVRARDGHLRRDRGLRETLMQHLHARNLAAAGAASMDLATLAHLNASAAVEDGGDRGALMWAVMAFVPVVNLLVTPVVLFQITRDLAVHDRRQAFFCYHAGIGLARTGKAVEEPRWRAHPNRTAGLYLILSYVSGGLFLYYWYYVLILDTNSHLASQQRFESSLASALKG